MSLPLPFVSASISEANGAATELLDMRELNLPMFVPDLPVQEYPAHHQAGIMRFIEACRRAEVMIWASPKYHARSAAG